jgi:hypothetical protein
MAVWQWSYAKAVRVDYVSLARLIGITAAPVTFASTMFRLLLHHCAALG